METWRDEVSRAAKNELLMRLTRIKARSTKGAFLAYDVITELLNFIEDDDIQWLVEDLVRLNRKSQAV